MADFVQIEKHILRTANINNITLGGKTLTIEAKDKSGIWKNITIDFETEELALNALSDVTRNLNRPN